MEIAILVGFLIFLRLIIKNTRTYKFILGIVLMLVAVPAGIFAELGVNGCCGAPSTGFKGAGYILMAVLLVSGFIFLMTSFRTSRA
jgi:hypothetical protein